MSDSPYRYDSREDYPAAWGMTPEQYAGTRENYDSTGTGHHPELTGERPLVTGDGGAMRHAFLGPRWSPEPMSRLVAATGLPAVDFRGRPAELLEAVVDRLVRGEVVGWFHGALELGPRKIAVNTVAPGAIMTDFSGGMVRDNPEVSRRVVEMTALGRVGQPDDVGPMIAALLSEDNRWVTAQRIEVSGGMSI